jgi:tellurite resistance protein TerA
MSSVFDRFKTPRTAAPAAPAHATPATGQHTTGTINLAKGKSINLSKGSGVITATCSWPPRTDYDVYALVLRQNGTVETVSTFGTKGHENDYRTATTDGAVKHLGDVKRSASAMASETIEIRLTPDVVGVVPVVYSAQSNGTGSFRRYQVSMSIDNGAGATVVIDAAHASDNDKIYTCVPGIIINEGGGVQVEAREQYSTAGSEKRPTLGPDLSISMDSGPTNAYK